MWHAAAAPNNLHPAVATTSSPALRRARWPIIRPSSSVKVQSSTRNGNGSADNLDHLQRASKGRQQRQGASAPGPRARRVVRTTPFGLWWDSFPEARTLDQMVRTIMDADDADTDARFGGVVPATAAAAPTAVPRADHGRTPWEVRERAGEYMVRFDMPGMARDDVRVSVQDRTLVVAAEKKQQPAADGGGDEEGDNEEEAWPPASFGRYRTRVELPENVDVERIAAEVKDGVLYLTIPKLSAGAKVVNIQVQ